jgi:hypothetical protein
VKILMQLMLILNQRLRNVSTELVKQTGGKKRY